MVAGLSEVDRCHGSTTPIRSIMAVRPRLDLLGGRRWINGREVS